MKKTIELNQSFMAIYDNQIKKANCLQTADIIDESDIIQETILALLEKNESIQDIKANDDNHLFNRIKRQKKWDLYRKTAKRAKKLECYFESFDFNPNDESINVFGNEEKTGFNDTVELIKSKLSAEDFNVFELYFLQDRTVRQIASILELSVMTAQRLITKVQNHVMRLKITELYDTQYLSTGGTCKGKWRVNYDTNASDIKTIECNGYQVKERIPHTIKDNEYAKSLNIHIELKKDYYGKQSDGILYKE